MLPNHCGACKDGVEQPFPFSMAFQPIVDVRNRRVFAYEALVRGVQGETAFSILSQVTETNRYAFDQACRVKAITLAVQLGLIETGAMLSINFIPGAVYSPAACIQLTIKTARSLGFPADRLIFEITEGEQVQDHAHLQGIAEYYRKCGFKMALDDFGAGYSGLNLLAGLPTDIVKLDMELTRNIHNRPSALAIVRHMTRLASDLEMEIVAEGVETLSEYTALLDCGITLMQGYLVAKPCFERLPDFRLPELHVLQAAS